MASVNITSSYIKHERALRKRIEAFFRHLFLRQILRWWNHNKLLKLHRPLDNYHKHTNRLLVLSYLLIFYGNERQWRWVFGGGRCCWRWCLSGTGQPSATTDRRTRRSPCFRPLPPPQNKKKLLSECVSPNARVAARPNGRRDGGGEKELYFQPPLTAKKSAALLKGNLQPNREFFVHDWNPNAFQLK